ncbi:MAG: YebC/PmpR family DNA-binding transcriptional regulator [Actinobacteria bacterium HGW-Actinobacteria-6]|jgi:YebC/PmpR family DNA-binding regulatory protein|nr:MAG: YebC/PmpR family DNA-binding transcriptional regulator [Actinobacteria bacterium HGW-Actinobacteria-6]
MSGHSKWATTKHRKAAQDKKRSAMFSKLSRIVYVAAKTGGPDPANNASLAAAMDKARSYSLPKDKIDAAIKKAAGAGEGEQYEEIVYEGYGSSGVAIYIEALTDNRNRTAADVRSAFTRAGGNLAATGAVAFQFVRNGEILVDKADAPDEEELMMLVADAGGDDIEDTDEDFVIVTGASDMNKVKDALVAAGVTVKGAELTMRALTPVTVTAETAKKVMRLVDVLEDNDDVQEVYHNMEMTEEIVAALDA